MELKLYPDPILRQNCKPVATIDREFKDNVGEMMRLISQHEGHAISAPQVGLSLQFFVCRLSPSVIINPTISHKRGSVIDWEKCLSIPEQIVSIRRAKQLTLHGYNIRGEEFTKVYKGMQARIIQHECDHLNGRLIIDYVCDRY